MTDWLEELLALAGEGEEQGELLRLLTLAGVAPIPVPVRGETSPAAAAEEQDVWTKSVRENGAALSPENRPAEAGVAAAGIAAAGIAEAAAAAGRKTARPESGAARSDLARDLGRWLFQGGAETEPPGGAGTGLTGGAALETGRAGREALSGLEGLYRRATETALAAAAVSAHPVRESALREEAPAAGLTAEELDRAVRRDSRRYDGAMSIY